MGITDNKIFVSEVFEVAKTKLMIADVETAVRIYYTYPELDNALIMELFGASRSTATKLKNKVREKMKEADVPNIKRYTVNTDIAYKTWGLNISALEKRLKKMRELGLCG